MADETQGWRKRIESKLDEICLLLTGGGNPHRGIIVRLDRLEQSNSRWAWVPRSVLTAVIAAVVAGGMAWVWK